MEITLEQLKRITNQKESILIPFLDPINKLFAQNVQISNLNICHFLAQVLHESGAFRYTVELASGEAYEGRKVLGNTEPGFGKLFKGRGLVQLTGYFNYKRLSEAFKVDFVSQPKLLETPEWAVKSAKWFWDIKGLNSLADQNDFLQITFKINGGFNGLKDRLKYLNSCFKIFQVPNREVFIKDILSRIEQNINLPKSNYYKTALAKQVPDLKTLNELRNSLS